MPIWGFICFLPCPLFAWYAISRLFQTLNIFGTITFFWLALHCYTSEADSPFLFLCVTRSVPLSKEAGRIFCFVSIFSREWQGGEFHAMVCSSWKPLSDHDGKEDPERDVSFVWSRSAFLMGSRNLRSTTQHSLESQTDFKLFLWEWITALHGKTNSPYKWITMADYDLAVSEAAIISQAVNPNRTSSLLTWIK